MKKTGYFTIISNDNYKFLRYRSSYHPILKFRFVLLSPRVLKMDGKFYSLYTFSMISDTFLLATEYKVNLDRPVVLVSTSCLGSQGGRGHWTVNYTGTQSYITIFSY